MGLSFEYRLGVHSQHSRLGSDTADLGASVGLGDKMLVAEPHGGMWRMVLRHQSGGEVVLADNVEASAARLSVASLAEAIAQAAAA